MKVQIVFQVLPSVCGAVSTGGGLFIHSLAHSFTHLMNVGDDNNNGDSGHLSPYVC